MLMLHLASVVDEVLFVVDDADDADDADAL